MGSETIHVIPKGFWGHSDTGNLLHWVRRKRDGQGDHFKAKCGEWVTGLTRNPAGRKCRACTK